LSSVQGAFPTDDGFALGGTTAAFGFGTNLSDGVPVVHGCVGGWRDWDVLVMRGGVDLMLGCAEGERFWLGEMRRCVCWEMFGSETL